VSFASIVLILLPSYLRYPFYQCCGSGMFIPDLGSWFLSARIPDLTTATKEGGKLVVLPFFVAKNIIKLLILYFLSGKNSSNFIKNYSTHFLVLAKKVSLSSHMGLGSGIQGPVSGKNLSRIPAPGVKKAPDPGPGSATLLFISIVWRLLLVSFLLFLFHNKKQYGIYHSEKTFCIIIFIWWGTIEKLKQ
jgi:hypothetical protein